MVDYFVFVILGVGLLGFVLTLLFLKNKSTKEKNKFANYINNMYVLNPKKLFDPKRITKAGMFLLVILLIVLSLKILFYFFKH